MTLTGTNFPPNDSYNLNIVLTGGVACIPSSISTTQIVCETQPFSSSNRRMLTTIDITMTYDDDEGSVSASQTGLALNPNPLSVTGITPAKISPIAFRTFVVQLDSTYPSAGMTTDDFTFKLIPD